MNQSPWLKNFLILTLSFAANFGFLGCSNNVAPPGPTESASLDASCVHTSAVTFDAPIAGDASFTMVSDSDWDEDAVRKVLQTFAFGGFASTQQIQAWADMPPGAAIVEMITFDASNPKLSPAESFDQLDTVDAKMSCFSKLWSYPHRQNKMPTDKRERFLLDTWNSPSKIWLHMVSKRGLNPVRQRIGIWATNYHLAVNLNVGVNFRQVVQYYDDITQDLALKKPFQDVLQNAALSAAVATQYGHRENRFRDGKFFGNDDFAREYFQLFFGILGSSANYTADYHESVTIPNMARALTDIRVPYITFSSGAEGYDSISHIATDYHYLGDLEILKTNISGANAREKLATLSQLAIANEESLANLPVMIISTLADDKMSAANKTHVRAIWAGLAQKDLLPFLRKYAISTAFHSADRVKYWTSLERNILQSNLTTLSNFESYQEYYNTEWRMNEETFELFRPSHNVFGHQTGLEAASSSTPFQLNYERNLRDYWFFARSSDRTYGWKKDWTSLIKKNEQGQYAVQDVAEFLWHHYLADRLKNFGTLEKYHLYSLLASGLDLATFIDAENPLHTYTETELETALSTPTVGLGKTLTELSKSVLQLESSEAWPKERDNYRIGLAIDFILATPFAFAQEGF